LLLRSIVLSLSTEQYPGRNSDFLFASCYVSNYVTQRIRKLRHGVEGFSTIVIEGCSERADTAAKVVPDRALRVLVDFSLSAYENLGLQERHELYLEMLRVGMDKAAVDFDVPLAATKQAIVEFREGGYRNSWIHASKPIQKGLKALLHCDLDPQRFRLALQLQRGAAVVREWTVLETRPDELIFAHRFKRLLVEGPNLVVRSKFDDLEFSKPLDEVVASS
jgi:hypothetical protein